MSVRDPASRASAEALVPLVYDELRAIARGYFHKQPAGFTLQPTELVNEACLHLLRHANVAWEGVEHFRAIATRKIWQVVVDHVKQRQAQKRGGRGCDATGEHRAEGETGVAGPGHAVVRQRVPLDSVSIPWHDGTIDLLDLADALDELAGESRRLRDVVMLHWFGGLKYEEVGRVLGVSVSTVEKDFRYALAWLSRRLADASERGD